MGSHQINKGKRWERALVRWLRDLGLPADRNLTETREGATGDVVAEWQFSPSSPHVLILVEAKHQKNPLPWKALRQAHAGAETGYPSDDIEVLPVAIVKKDRTPPEVWMQEATFRRFEQLRDLEGQDYSFKVRTHRQTKEEAYVIPCDHFANLVVGLWLTP